ncbi:hypothetical protein HpDR16_16730 [Helicobacter pylori]
MHVCRSVLSCGVGVIQNFKKAFGYYSKACELNEALTCMFVGAFYRVV